MDAYISFADKAPERVHCVKYEDLLTDPLECAKRLAGFFNLEVTPELSNQIAKMSIRPNKSRKWEKLSAKDLAITETVFADVLKRFNYERGASCNLTPSNLEGIALAAKDSLLRVPQKIGVKIRRYVRG